MAKENYKYTKTHEWIDLFEPHKARIGITDHAQEQLGDIVFVNLPEIARAVEAGEAIMDVESVKAASDIYTPLSGKVSWVNDALETAPEKINEAAYETVLFELEDIEIPDDLWTLEEYLDFLKREEDE